MALDIACLNVNFTLPNIPIINNVTNIPSHPHYNPNGKALSQLISSSMARSTFSTDDFESFLKMITSSNNTSFDISTVVKSKPVTSTIIYTSITLALFIILSLIFCIMSCRKNHPKNQRCKCCGPCVPVVLLILVGLIVIGQMIYIAYQVDKTTKNLDESIKEMNQEIYPKEISVHLKHLLQQMELLDEYSTQNDSILIQASRSIFIGAFDKILREQYFLDTIRDSIVDIDIHMEQLNHTINNESSSLLPVVKDLFGEIKNQQQDMIEQLNKPLQELCRYSNGNEVEIDNTILNALDLVHKQLRILIDTIKQDFLEYMTVLMKQDLEDRVRYYIRLVGIILLVLIIIFGLIPISFLAIIILCRCCRYQRQKSSSKYRLVNEKYFHLLL
ncbi:unnamed protein product [Adineta steineri]|uniref:Uncharacterized protein n=1 Tax=Adineta steineri TaxID=433720 RepID=A0A815FR52_9BILA|nr:unnamed protein product [Adineta steineri]CAF3698798.1 unnamed protein product [Adineta steineri]CAF4212991.1 unnamed protein product [Adineta steineri]